MLTEDLRYKNFVWKDSDNPALYEVLCKQISLGRKASGHFTAEAWTEIVNECREKINPTIDKDKVVNRMRTLKDRYIQMRDIRSKLSSGWSEDANMIQVDDSVWTDLIAEYPKWAPYRYRSFEEFPTLCFLFIENPATSVYATPLNEDVHSIHDTKPLLVDNACPHNIAEKEVPTRSTPSATTDKAKRKRDAEVRKGKRKKTAFDRFTYAMNNLTKAIVGLQPPCDIGKKCLAMAKGFDLSSSEIMWAIEIFKDKDDCLMFENLDQTEQLSWLHWKIELKRLQLDKGC